jgi:hypothetical protein
MDLVRRGSYTDTCHCPETSRDANGSADIIDKVISNVAGFTPMLYSAKTQQERANSLCLFADIGFILFMRGSEETWTTGLWSESFI